MPLVMDYGVHLPLTTFGGSFKDLLAYTESAERLGFQAISVNDHLVHSRPWLDGPTALASVLTRTGRMALATTVALPVVRGPLPLAKSLAAIDQLSGGRLIVGLGPGSSAQDYASVGIPFEERWKRFDEAVQVLRSLLSREGGLFKGRYYSTEGIKLQPYPRDQGAPSIWIGGWGSEVGLRRVARLGDGWFASALHTTPESFKTAWKQLQENLARMGKDPDRFPNAIATMYFYISEQRSKAEQVAQNVLGHLIRPGDKPGERFLIGSVEQCAERLAAYQAAGAQRVFLWPIADELSQITIFRERVVPLVGS